MKPKLTDGKLAVELHKKDIQQLQQAREIACLLIELKQEEGMALHDAITVILAKWDKDREDDNGPE